MHAFANRTHPMLKHRQDGLIFLHGLCLHVAIVALFLVQVAVYHWRSGWSGAAAGLNWGLYLVGVSAAMAWNHHVLPAVAVRLGVLNFAETLRLTRQQLYRLMAVLFAVAFATQDTEVPRGFIAGFIALAGGGLFIANWALPRRLADFLFRTLKFRTVVLTSAAEAGRLQDWLCARQYLGQVLVGCVLPADETWSPGAVVPVLGRMGELDLPRLLTEKQINQIMINRRLFTAAELERILAAAERAACRVRYFIDLHAIFGDEPAAVECHECYAFAAQAAEPLDNPVNSLLKRVFDLTVAIPVVLCVLPPLTLAVWLMQRMQSPGPVFYRQERSGLNRQRFHIFKYRTMYHNAGSENRQATQHDARVFPFGRYLRKTSLDEFPQFINVLLGEMSVSGPRPHLLEHDRQFAALIGSYYKRHFVKPGITGLAQSEGLRGEVAGHPELLQQRIDHDLRYVNMWSLELDLRIMMATARQVVRPPRAAY